ncbi:MAG: M67 family metallopeptidase [Chloroflexi bacterium]|nr:M67 family metallopeptidase [Chloroflexota bacterium]MCI0576740.1 M67 family metallopeptidase [Chloroflexota bacterium]MCI0645998.1 M67 family metallopeptidase [Chloroflexota bacterium]MCI0726853.1 M67 family metallopeptidase [Chloroflexota bacterium]
MYQALLEHLQAVYPLEGCGFMAGRDGVVYRLYPVANRLTSARAYEMEPQEQVAALLDMEASGWDLLAIYHSHPQGPELPSPTDVAQAHYPEAIQVIVSLQDLDRPVVRGFTIVEGQVGEALLQVV